MSFTLRDGTRIEAQFGGHGAWIATSPDDPGLLVAEMKHQDLRKACEKARADLQRVRKVRERMAEIVRRQQ